MNHRELLSIAIPTRNRVGYLRDLLAELEKQIREEQFSPEQVRILVSDNASTDETQSLLHDTARRLPHLTNHRNPENIGCLPNFMRCVELATGRFCWISGDDDLLQPGALRHVVRTLADPELALMINLQTGYRARLQLPRRFPNYRAYAAECARVHPHVLLEHTLVTSNIFRTSCFDQAAAARTLHTSFAHMYALVAGVVAQGGGVFVSGTPVIQVRNRRAPAVDAEWPPDLEGSWIDYLTWQKALLDLPELEPHAAIDEVRQALFTRIRSNPAKYVWDNLPALVQPRAYSFFGRRLWRFLRRRPPAK